MKKLHKFREILKTFILVVYNYVHKKVFTLNALIFSFGQRLTTVLIFAVERNPLTNITSIYKKLNENVPKNKQNNVIIGDSNSVDLLLRGLTV